MAGGQKPCCWDSEGRRSQARPSSGPMSRAEIRFPAECHDCGAQTEPWWDAEKRMYIILLVEELRLLAPVNDYYVCCKKCSAARGTLASS